MKAFLGTPVDALHIHDLQLETTPGGSLANRVVLLRRKRSMYLNLSLILAVLVDG